MSDPLRSRSQSKMSSSHALRSRSQMSNPLRSHSQTSVWAPQPPMTRQRPKLRPTRRRPRSRSQTSAWAQQPPMTRQRPKLRPTRLRPALQAPRWTTPGCWQLAAIPEAGRPLSEHWMLQSCPLITPLWLLRRWTAVTLTYMPQRLWWPMKIMVSCLLRTLLWTLRTWLTRLSPSRTLKSHLRPRCRMSA